MYKYVDIISETFTQSNSIDKSRFEGQLEKHSFLFANDLYECLLKVKLNIKINDPLPEGKDDSSIKDLFRHSSSSLLFAYCIDNNITDVSDFKDILTYFIYEKHVMDTSNIYHSRMDQNLRNQMIVEFNDHNNTKISNEDYGKYISKYYGGNPPTYR